MSTKADKLRAWIDRRTNNPTVRGEFGREHVTKLLDGALAEAFEAGKQAGAVDTMVWVRQHLQTLPNGTCIGETEQFNERFDWLRKRGLT